MADDDDFGAFEGLDDDADAGVHQLQQQLWQQQQQ
jgi:hypothetical protein